VSGKKTRAEIEELFSRIDFNLKLQNLIEELAFYGDQFTDFSAVKKAPLQDFTEQVWEVSEDGSDRYDRYADYAEMDDYPLIAGPFANDATRPRKTPLQEFTEQVWEKDSLLKRWWKLIFSE